MSEIHKAQSKKGRRPAVRDLRQVFSLRRAVLIRAMSGKIVKTNRRVAALAALAAMLAQSVYPLAAVALTSGPSQPEFSEFTPVGTSEMVNPFTGDFTYNIPVVTIPGPNGAGYALSLSYNSGKSGEDEASWVGRGWTLNPGAIVRQKRGFPDDYKGQTVRYRNFVEPNYTVTVNKALGVEAFSQNKMELEPEQYGPQDPNANLTSTFGVNMSVVTRYNNRTGYSHTFGIGLDVWGLADLGYSVTDGESSFSAQINPAKLLNDAWQKANYYNVQGGSEREKSFRRQMAHNNSAAGSFGNTLNALAGDVTRMLGEETRTTHFPAYTGVTYQFHVGVQGNPTPLPIGLRGGFDGTYSKQENVPLESIPAYGYMYSGHVTENGAMDYYVEKDGGYNKRDRYLGIPFSNADNFLATGEGISGGFRIHHRRIGKFRPAPKHSAMDVVALGGDISLGANFGAGGNVSLSFKSLDIETWDDEAITNNYWFAHADQGNESVFFRFYNDLGGTIAYSGGDRAIATQFKGTGVEIVTGLFALKEAPISPLMNGGKRSGRASYIGYATNREMTEQPKYLCYGADGPSYFRSYNKLDSTRKFVDRTDPKIQDGIGEFSVTRSDGMRYTYGLPVYSRNERDLYFEIGGARVPDGYLAFKSRTAADGGYVVGEERDEPYASMYLLTEIVTPDYVDRTNDGPTEDDLGGYTLFHYKRTAGSDRKSGAMSTDWYKWRTPYRGMLYQRNSLSDYRDDQGFVSYGEKEIYYLEAIETRTHIAKFITSPRRDGYEADRDEANATGSATSTGVGGTNKMHKLDRIELYPKNPDGTLGRVLTTVRMEYDYSMGRNLPNAETDGATRCGALTLRRLWVEHEGAVNARISPYTFGYHYRKTTDYSALSSELQTKYASVIGYADALDSTEQNPNYSPFDTDRWGYYRRNGVERARIFNPWVDQNPDPAQFDPAAYQLKAIQLPSGGEIHVQYEQKDYSSVQDRPAMAMVPLRSTASGDDDGDKVTLHLDLAHLGITNSTEIAALYQKLKDHFEKQHNMLHFKFLYALSGTEANFTNCASDFITGYVPVDRVEYNGAATPPDLKIILHPAGNQYRNPQDVARRFVATSRSGLLGPWPCDPRASTVPSTNDNAWDHINNLIFHANDVYYDAGTTATKRNLVHSYVRIPIYRDKLGGGVRVKRLLTYDRGIETGAAALYGQEFLYENENGTSSGVATNEPGLGREENPLVGYLEKRAPQSGISRVISGRDKEQFEGPLGESILPGPSIGYARVVTRSIHSGETGTGYAVNTYFTARDFPYDMRYIIGSDTLGGLQNTEVVSRDIRAMLYAGPASYRRNNIFRTQGYCFIQNEMHGKPRSVAAYAERGSAPISEQTYEYFQPGEAVPMLYKGNTVVNDHPGKETEVVVESRAIKDITRSGNQNFDFTIGMFSVFPVPFATAFPQVSQGEEKMYTHVITRVVRYPAIVKKMTVKKDGVTAESEYAGFDPKSGRPVLVKTNDGYHNLTLGASSTPHVGTYFARSFPAWTEYAGLGQLAETERMVIGSGDSLAIEKRYYNRHFLNFRFLRRGMVAGTLGMLTPGDLIQLKSGTAYLGTFHVGAIRGNQVELVPTYISNTSTAASIAVTRLEIIRSNRTNQVGLDVGSVTTYGQAPVIVGHPMQ